jgi:transcriptional regulator with XRE-family HTH domain
MGNVVNRTRLGELIAARYPSQSAFARGCGVSPQYVNQVLQGEVVPSLARMVQFAVLLGVSMDELVIRDAGGQEGGRR